MFSEFTSVVTCVNNIQFAFSDRVPFHPVSRLRFVGVSPVDERPGCVHLWAVTARVLVNICVFVCLPVFNTSGYTLRSAVAEHMETLCLTF